MKPAERLYLIKDMIKKHEGWRSKPYHDSEGILTIGYGFNIGQGISREEGEAILDLRINKVLASTTSIEEFKHLSEIRQIIIIDMIYNMGLGRVKRFKKMLRAIKEKDWEKAGDEMLDSKWAKQVGKRARDLAKIMRSGEL